MKKKTLPGDVDLTGSKNLHREQSQSISNRTYILLCKTHRAGLNPGVSGGGMRVRSVHHPFVVDKLVDAQECTLQSKIVLKKPENKT